MLYSESFRVTEIFDKDVSRACVCVSCIVFALTQNFSCFSNTLALSIVRSSSLAVTCPCMISIAGNINSKALSSFQTGYLFL